MASYSNLLKLIKEKNQIILNFSLIEDVINIKYTHYEKNKDEIALCHKYKDDLNKQNKIIEEKDSEIYIIEKGINNIENEIEKESRI